MRSITACCASIVVALLLTGTAQADPGRYTRTADHLEREVTRALAEHNIPGLSIALVDERGIAWSRGFGLADLQDEIPATTATRYRTGSVTKLLTAAAVLQLVEVGRIELDRPVTDYLPEFAMRSRFDSTTAVTVRQLLTHHGGLPTDLHKGMWSDMPFTQVLGRLSEEHAVYPPGLVHAYSNVGYSLLGHLIEAVTDRTYEDVIAEQILAPLDMRDANFSLGDLATGYGGREPGVVLPVRDIPAMGLTASVTDLARFLGLFLGEGQPAVLSRGLAMESMRAQNLQVALDLDDRVGIGWTLDRCRLSNVGTVAEHGGTTLLYAGQLMVVPRYGLGVVVLTNTAGARGVVKQLAEEALIAAIDERYAVDAEQRPASMLPTLAVGGGSMDGERSSYITGGGLLTLDTRDDELCACTPRSRMSLIPEPEGWYRLRRSGAKAEEGPRLARRTIDGQDVVVIEADGRQQRLGTRVEVDQIPDAWLDRIGDYQVVNTDPGFPVSHVCLFEEDGLLFFGYRMPRLSPRDVALPLVALNEAEAVVLGMGRNRGDTLSIRRVGGQEYLKFSGYLARRVHDPFAMD